MSNVIDSLVLSLGLDTTDLKKGQREVEDTWKRTSESSIRRAKEVEGANKVLVESFAKLKGEALEFFAILSSAKAIKDFVEKINGANVALGLLSENLGENPRQLEAWGLAVKRIGGNSEEAKASIGRLSKAFYDAATNGKALPTEVYRAFAATNRTVDTSKGLFGFLNDCAGALKEIAKTNPSQAFFLGQGSGLDAGSVNMMIRYGDAVSKYAASMQNLTATKEQIAASEELNKKWQEGLDIVNHIGNTINQWISPALL